MGDYKINVSPMMGTERNDTVTVFIRPFTGPHLTCGSKRQSTGPHLFLQFYGHGLADVPKSVVALDIENDFDIDSGSIPRVAGPSFFCSSLSKNSALKYRFLFPL